MQIQAYIHQRSLYLTALHSATCTSARQDSHCHTPAKPGPLTFSTSAWPTTVPPPLAGQGTKRDHITKRCVSFHLNVRLKKLSKYKDVCQGGKTRCELCPPARGGTRTEKAPQGLWEEHSHEAKDSWRGRMLRVQKWHNVNKSHRCQMYCPKILSSY